MSNNPNFVSELVQMARAFEELPEVKQQLDAVTHELTEAQATIQRLELRLIDAKNETEAAHSATRKAEVERDHAETMFLETDDKLQKGLDVLKTFIGDAGDFIRAVQPVPEPVAEAPKAEPVPLEPQTGHPEPTAEASPATNTEGQSGTTSPAEGGSSGNTGESATGEQTTAASGTTEPSIAPIEPAASTSEPSSVSGADAQPGQSEPGPTNPATSTAPTPPSADTAPTELATAPSDSPPQDDVGYHNEPSYDSADWYTWRTKMDARYGFNNWPSRLAS